MTKSRRFYIAVEVDYFDHPKTLRVGEKLAYRNLRAQAWCHKHRTDGFLPREAALSIVFSPKAINELVAAGLWEVCDAGWRIHDYLDHQPSSEGLEKLSAAGKRGAAGRYGNG